MDVHTIYHTATAAAAAVTDMFTVGSDKSNASFRFSVWLHSSRAIFIVAINVRINGHAGDLRHAWKISGVLCPHIYLSQ